MRRENARGRAAVPESGREKKIGSIVKLRSSKVRPGEEERNAGEDREERVTGGRERRWERDRKKESSVRRVRARAAYNSGSKLVERIEYNYE